MNNEGLKFKRIDADINESMKGSEESDEALKEKQSKFADKVKETLNINKLSVKVENLANKEIASMITVSEESRRLQDMMKQYAMMGMGGMLDTLEETLILNSNNELVKKLIDEETPDKAICEQLYDLAKLSHGSLEPERMAKFIARTNDLMLNSK